MLGSILDNRALQSARAAFDGLTRRQEAISNNIANIDTPGYGRQVVSFEHALKREIGHDESAAPQLQTTDARHFSGLQSGGPNRPGQIDPRDVVADRNDANAVGIDEEMVLLAETQIRYQSMTQLVGRRLATLRTAIRGQ